MKITIQFRLSKLQFIVQMKDNEILTILENNFGIKTNRSELDTNSEFYKYLQQILSERIKFFIRTDLDKLLHILYRIDISQKDTDDSFDLGEINRISYDLAEKIIKRQLKKIAYSKKFHKKD